MLRDSVVGTQYQAARPRASPGAEPASGSARTVSAARGVISSEEAATQSAAGQLSSALAASPRRVSTPWRHGRGFSTA